MPNIDSSFNFLFTVFMLTTAVVAVRQKRFRPIKTIALGLLVSGIFVVVDEQGLYYYLVEWSGDAIPKNPNFVTLIPLFFFLPYLAYRLVKRPTLHGWVLSVAMVAVVSIGVGYHVLIVHTQLVADFKEHQVINMERIAKSPRLDPAQCETFGYACFKRAKDIHPATIDSSRIKALPDYVQTAISGVHGHYDGNKSGGFGDVILIDSGAVAYGYYLASGAKEYRLVLDLIHTDERLTMSRNLFRTLLLFAQISWIAISWILLLFHCWYLPRRRRLNRGFPKAKALIGSD